MDDDVAALVIDNGSGKIKEVLGGLTFMTNV